MQPFLTVESQSPYPIYLGAGCLADIGKYVKQLGRRVAIICDDSVARHHAKPLLDALDAQLFTFPAGESAKSRQTKAELEDQLLAAGYLRDTVIIAVGGGVSLDLAGFIASTYCRGVPAVYVPTSLLAMIDVCIGGKTGINTQYGKNTIGTFTTPKAVFIDPTVLTTLPHEELNVGFAESIKHALITDPDFLAWHAANRADLQNPLSGKFIQLLQKNLHIKHQIVSQDEFEQGLRQILNFGHTFAHALEAISNYAISHGHAVALGMLAEAYLSKLPANDFEQIHAILVEFDLLRPIPVAFQNADKLIAAMQLDKKNTDQQPACVLLRKIGEVDDSEQRYARPVASELLIESIQYLIEQCRHGFKHS